MKKRYDAIIIGAGISGLVCGNYLARAGKKVLIAEQHWQAGGYCGSFKRNNFLFDIGVHYLGGLKENGRLRKLLTDLKIQNDISFVRFNPSDTIITPEHEVHFYSNFDRTVDELVDCFPKEEKGIRSFYSAMAEKNFYSAYMKFRKTTFKDVLDEFFDSADIRTILSSVLGNVGLPPSRTPALTAMVLFQDFIFNSGYYPRNGMQTLPNLLISAFKESGGEIRLKTKVTKIMISKSGKIKGACLNDSVFVEGRQIISCCDIRQTYIDLVEKEHLQSAFLEKLNSLMPSISAFMLYLGVSEACIAKFKKSGTVWYMPRNDIEEIYSNIFNKTILKDKYFISFFPSFHDASLAPQGYATMELIIGAPFMDKEFWETNRKNVENDLIERTEKIIPGLRDSIVIKESATPHTFYRYTLNSQGALYGLASTPKQIERSYLSQRSPIKNLFLAGHWLPSSGLGQGGVAGCIYSGQNAAKLVLENE